MSKTIEAKVNAKIQNNDMFTSVDVSNEIKTEGEWARNRDVAAYLRQLALPVMYSKTVIDVNNSQSQATLYYAIGADTDEYKGANQTAMTYPEYEALLEEKKKLAVKPVLPKVKKIVALDPNLVRINEVIEDKSGVKIDGKIDLAENMEDSMGLDSLDSVELVMALEDEFNVEISDELAEPARTVLDVYKIMAGVLDVPILVASQTTTDSDVEDDDDDDDDDDDVVDTFTGEKKEIAITKNPSRVKIPVAIVAQLRVSTSPTGFYNVFVNNIRIKKPVMVTADGRMNVPVKVTSAFFCKAYVNNGNLYVNY